MPNKNSNGIYINLAPTQEAKDLYDAINRYRKLEGMKWRSFILLSVAGRVAKDNPELAQKIIDFVVEN